MELLIKIDFKLFTKQDSLILLNFIFLSQTFAI